MQTISEGSILSPGSPVDESEPTVRHPASLLHINRNQFMVVPDNPEDKCLSSYSGSSASGLRVSSSSLGQDKTEFTVVADGSDSSVSIPFEDFIEVRGPFVAGLYRRVSSVLTADAACFAVSR